MTSLRLSVLFAVLAFAVLAAIPLAPLVQTWASIDRQSLWTASLPVDGDNFCGHK